jgi:2-polyprenyl-6-methoxyphenol hydroxylase-like FAD-dependent oxidoreductase
MPLRVLIAGAGLGGLTLAHALRTAGLDVAVFESDQPHPEQRDESYRIHIDGTGSRALHQCLPTELWEQFVAHSAAAPRGIAFTTEHLRQLAFVPDVDPDVEPVAHAHPISRAGLRQLLLSGLHDVVTWDRRLIGYILQADGQVVAQFADGSSTGGDVLVGADGWRSTVRKQLLPHARVVDTGVAGIAGKLYLDGRTHRLVPPDLLSQMTMVLPKVGCALFMAGFRRPAGVQSGEALDLPEHLFWVLLSRADALELGPRARLRSGGDLLPRVLRQVEPWHPLLGQIIAESDPHSLVGVPLYSSLTVRPWRTTAVTLLGDAVHTMTPLQGLGGNTALRDAALLSQQLCAVERHQTDLLSAIHAYETAMLAYGFDAVQRSLQVSNAVASSNVLGRMAFRAVLRTADRLPWLKRRMFERPHVDLPTAGGTLATAVQFTS